MFTISMASVRTPPLTMIFLIAISSGALLSGSTNITIVNHCKETVWPGITPSENISSTGSPTLKPGEHTVFTAPPGWHGRIWGRTGCSFDNSDNGTCKTGSCGSALKCTEPGQEPSTIVDFSLGETDFYDVSLVGGFNMPMVVKPLNGKGDCSTAGCDGDLRDNCPSELALKDDGNNTIACRSACDVFKTDEYCCRGIYGNATSCQPTNYSTTFKKLCPAAYSYAFDNRTSVVTCSSVSDYVVTFCASRNQKSCRYHGQQLVCNSSGLSMNRGTLSNIWWIVMLILLSMIS